MSRCQRGVRLEPTPDHPARLPALLPYTLPSLLCDSPLLCTAKLAHPPPPSSRKSCPSTIAPDTAARQKSNLNTPPQTTLTMPKEAKEKTTTKRAAAKTRTEKKKKDPNAPKRGLSAYMFFANEQRDNVREENPGITFGQVGKVLGERWKALNDKQRAPYEAKAATDKKRYEDEKASYNADAEEEESS